MKKSLLWVILLAIVLGMAVFYTMQPATPVTSEGKGGLPVVDEAIASLAPTGPGAEAPPFQVEPRSRYVIDVVLHTVDEIEEMIGKAERLAGRPRSANEPASVAIVLHGEEVDIFSIRNYSKYHQLVDRAARLDAYNIIEVKMCMTSMRMRGMRSEDVPGFIELVPYGPEEIKKLQQNGYVKL